VSVVFFQIGFDTVRRWDGIAGHGGAEHADVVFATGDVARVAGDVTTLRAFHCAGKEIMCGRTLRIQQLALGRTLQSIVWYTAILSKITMIR